jgi:hypothetical protein
MATTYGPMYDLRTREQLAREIEYPYYDERDEKGLRIVFAISVLALISIFVWAFVSKALYEQGAREWGNTAQNPPAHMQPNGVNP